MSTYHYNEASNLRGIRGWLVLLGVNVLLAPIVSLLLFVKFGPESAGLTRFLFLPLAAFQVVLIPLFFRLKPLFPNLEIVSLLFSFIMYAFASETSFDFAFVRYALITVAWCAYLLFSKRVEATFDGLSRPAV